MSNTNTDLLWNPFTRIAGWQAMIFGWIFMAIAATVGAYNNVAFDGALDIHLYSLPIWLNIIFIFSDWNIVFIVMALGSLLMKKQYRFVDLAGTLAFARSPFIIAGILGFIATPLTLEQLESAQGVLPFSGGTVIFMFIAIACVAWNIALTYNALKLSCDIKGKNLTLLIILGLLVAEVITTFLKMQFVGDYIQ